MVLQPVVAQRWLLGLSLGLGWALAVGCGKGQGGTQSTPPGPSSHGAEATGGDAEREAVADGGSRSAADRAPDPAASEGDEELYIDGVRLRLRPVDCTLAATFLEQRLDHHFDFPGACHFAPGPNGQPWVVSTDHGKTVLVASSVPAEGGDCTTALQVVVVTERGPQLSREIQRVTGCGPGPWDEIMYHVLASDRVALGSGS